MDIQPGRTVKIEITATPRNAAAEKTLIRLCRKDPQVATRNRWVDRHRPSLRTHQRGGRQWAHRMKRNTGVTVAPGQSYSVRATVDVIRDLESVARWIKVTPQ